MNVQLLKRYAWLLLALLLPLGFVACSDSDEPEKVIQNPEEEDKKEEEKEDEKVTVYQDEKAYANFFAYNVLNDVYLWKQDITGALNSWQILTNPMEAVANARYKNESGEDIDRWTEMTDSYSEMVSGVDGVSTGTYGFSFKAYYKAENSQAVVAFVTYTYPDSPAEEAGLQRGDVIMEIDGKELNVSNYRDLYTSSTMTVGVGKYLGEGNYSSVEKTLSLSAVSMYEDPVVLTKVFDCGGKKVGYLLYTSFTFESSVGLYEVCKEFKKEGITELIIDLRYNGGGYVFTQEVLASMLAPETEVKNGSVLETQVWNDDYMAYYKKNNVDLNTYLTTEFKQKHNDKTYEINTSDANIGLTKIYALVTGSSASASEALLVGLMPYMDIEVIGEQTHGKYCSGIMWKGEEWFQDIVDYYKENDYVFAEEHPQFADWKNYIADWGIYVMISMYADKNGNNPCMPDGLTPDVEASDIVSESYPLGDEREAMLNVALQRAGKTDLQARVTSRSVHALSVGKAIGVSKNPLDGKLIYTGYKVKPGKLEMPK